VEIIKRKEDQSFSFLGKKHSASSLLRKRCEEIIRKKDSIINPEKVEFLQVSAMLNLLG
jgi:hypothetical protein